MKDTLSMARSMGREHMWILMAIPSMETGVRERDKGQENFDWKAQQKVSIGTGKMTNFFKNSLNESYDFIVDWKLFEV